MSLRLGNSRGPTAILYLVNAGIALAILCCFWRGTQTTALLATPAESIPLPPLDLSVHATPANLSVIQDTPLFYATRQYFVPPATTTPSTPPLPSYHLVGTFISPGKPAVAVVKDDAAGTSLRVVAGQNVAGWLVKAVESRRVVLEYEKESREIVAAQSEGSHGIGAVVAAAPVVRAGALTSRDGVGPAGTQVAPAGSQVAPRTLSVITTPSNSDPAASAGYVNPHQRLDVTRFYLGPKQ
jgi:hypothetical protein